MELLRRTLFRGKPEARALMVGLDAAGRTTILYKMILGEVVTTIPTIGFNVETIKLPKLNLTVWDVGGCDKIRPLWRHYYQNTSAVIFVVDSNDRERIVEAGEELGKMLCEDELRSAIVMVLANKQDLPNCMSVAEVAEKINLKQYCKNKVYAIFGTSGPQGEGIWEAFTWLSSTVLGEKQLKLQQTTDPIVNPLLEYSESDIIERIRLETDMPASSEQFLQDFEKGKVHVFDHRAHLRVGFLVLYDCAINGMKQSVAVDRFISVLRNFFTLADKTQIRPTFHTTMTIFWCHAIHLALSIFLQKISKEQNVEQTLPTTERLFVEFLLSHPILMWSGYWTRHYSKNVMMSPGAKEKFVLPDLKPLPAYMTLQGASDTRSREPEQEKKEMDDDEFLESFNEGKLTTFDETSLARICFVSLQRRSQERRALVVSDIMEKLQRLLIRIKASGNTKDLIVFSQTQVYFWIQIINAAFASLSFQSAADSTSEEHKQAMQRLSFHSFILLFPEFRPQSQPWKLFYSEDCFNSMEARRAFKTPDKKQLPNFFTKRVVDDSFLLSDESKLVVKRPAIHLLENLAKQTVAAIEASESLIEISEESLDGIDGIKLSDKCLANAIRYGKLSKITHFDLVRMIFYHISDGWERGDRGTVSITRIFDHLECYWEAKGNKYSGPAIPVLKPNTELFENLFSNRFTDHFTGMTHIHFWIQMVIASMVTATHYRPKALLKFSSFVDQYPELLWDELWAVYFSPEICFSPEAQAMVVPSDRNPLPAFLAKK